jgi:hypothetical protein
MSIEENHTPPNAENFLEVNGTQVLKFFLIMDFAGWDTGRGAAYYFGENTLFDLVFKWCVADTKAERARLKQKAINEHFGGQERFEESKRLMMEAIFGEMPDP